MPRRERFWAHVDKSGDCWLWVGSVNKRRGGYGYFYDDDTRLRRAHRVAWELETGEALPPEVALCHKCDNPRCVRPSHCFTGTQADNMADMRAKGRDHLFTAGNVERGTARYNAKLNPDRVRTLRATHAAGGNVAALAREYGVTQTCAHLAATGRSWAHIT